MTLDSSNLPETSDESTPFPEKSSKGKRTLKKASTEESPDPSVGAPEPLKPHEEPWPETPISVPQTILEQSELDDVLKAHEIWIRNVLSTDSKSLIGRANLEGMDLRTFDLKGKNLSGAQLKNTNMSEMDLSGTIFSAANLSGANLACAHMEGANLRGAKLDKALLVGVDLSVVLPKNLDTSKAILTSESNETAKGASL